MQTDEPLARLLVFAKEELKTKGWYQNGCKGPHGEMCLGYSIGMFGGPTIDIDEIANAEKVLQRAIFQEHQAFCHEAGWQSWEEVNIPQFNDSPLIGKEEIFKVLDLAIENSK